MSNDNVKWWDITPPLRVDSGKGCRERRGRVSSVGQGRCMEDVAHRLLERQTLLMSMRCSPSHCLDSLSNDDKLLMILGKECQAVDCSFSLMKQWTPTLLNLNVCISCVMFNGAVLPVVPVGMWEMNNMNMIMSIPI